MAHRTFRDEIGREWDVWEVVPTAVERRMAKAAPRASALERRRVQEVRVVVPDSLQKGWLAFQSGSERRRLAPIPADWLRCSDERLEEYCGQALEVRRTGGLSLDN